MILPNSKYLDDDEEVVLDGKLLRQHRDVCRNEGYLQALDDVLNLPVKDFTGDFIKQVYELKKEFEKKEGETK